MPDMARYDPFSPTFDHPLLNSSPDYGSRNGSCRAGPIGDFIAHNAHREKCKRLRRQEDEKMQFIEDLLFQLENTQSRLERLQTDYAIELQHARKSSLQGETLQEQLLQMKNVMNRNSYVYVLIDGNDFLFAKDLLRRGLEGGREAATKISDTVNQFILTNPSYSTPPKIVVRIYADFKSLSDRLLAAKHIEQASIFLQFARGFNASKHSFDLVDTTIVNEKINEAFQDNLYNCHCHEILLGCSSRKEPAALLTSGVDDPKILNHVTLIENVMTGSTPGLSRLGIKTTTLSNIFDTKQPDLNIASPKPPPAVIAALPMLSKVESNHSSTTKSTSSTPQLNWATVTAQAASLPFTKPSDARAATPTSTKGDGLGSRFTSGTGITERNRLGQRIDSMDSTVPAYEIQRIKKLKLCNTFYLQGPSMCTSGHCNHSHTYPLSKGEKRILREVARMTPCYYKSECEDPDCIYGHRCPQSKPNEVDCYYGQDCRFYGWGHGIDTRVVKTTKV